MSQIRILTCACCGKGFKGKQGYQRDKGFGICPDCRQYYDESDW